ncbi:MAG: YifB family Mg chelatase-like AAA ATPase [Planctomycetes bacterium]|nr:YifB family Mg chelatase-like AAA ATPase [Planctomycetota bacterium]
MFTRLHSISAQGLSLHPIEVEVDTGRGLPGMIIVGLPGKAIMESRDRVKTALLNTSMPFPRARVTVNLAPGDLKKEGPLFDLPIALGVMICTDFLPSSLDTDEYIFVGELSLDGYLRPVHGVLGMALYAKEKSKKLMVPTSNYGEATLVDGLEVIPVNHLNDVFAYFQKTKSADELISLAKKAQAPVKESPSLQKDFSEVKGQAGAKRAMMIAAAGGHNLLMLGAPGSGKSMLAERFSGILPPLSREEALSVTRIYSVAGLLQHHTPLITHRPFRSPHHTISDVALIGGGSDAKPGEISLTHNGTLFLDELPEFKRSTLEVLRQPLESGMITIGRSKQVSEYPANFTFLAAMNPCPCGYYGSQLRNCRCNSTQIERYLAKLSGPLLDRIDIHIEVTDQSPALLRRMQKGGASSEEMQARVLAAHQVQAMRYKGTDFNRNGDLRAGSVEKYCPLEEEGESFLIKAMEELGLSTRAFHKILLVSRTIADLEEEESISTQHLSEALNYRVLDQKIFN